MSSRIRWFAGLAIVGAAALPVSAQQQTCAATNPNNAPTCDKSNEASASVNNVLILKVANPTIDLKGSAADSTLYQKTWTANGNAAGTTGVDPATITALADASASDSVTVLANRPYSLKVVATDDNFYFDTNGQPGSTCRVSGSSPQGASVNCAASVSPAGKSVHDVFVKCVHADCSSTAWSHLKGPADGDGSGTELVNKATTGGRFDSRIDIKSAWYFASDVPGDYRVTFKYTVTGQ